MEFPAKLAEFADDTFRMSGVWALGVKTAEEFYTASHEAFESGDDEMGQMYQDQATGAMKMVHLILAATIQHNVKQDNRTDEAELQKALTEAIQFVNERTASKAYGFMSGMQA